MSVPHRAWSRGAVPVPTGAEAAAFDRAAHDDGIVEGALMESAGRAAADLARHLAPSGPVVVLAGSGHNGGDGIVAGRTLQARGRDVRVVVVGERPTPDPLTHGWDLATVEAAELGAAGTTELLGRAGLVIDALLGTGIRGAARPSIAAVIRCLDGGRAPVLALDVPSGVDADRGAVAGAAVRANVTLAFGWPKLGVLLEPGRSRAGRVVAAEIGFPPLGSRGFGARLLTPSWLDQVRPRRAAVTHKNQVGAVLVVAGHAGMAGAAVLASRAALRSGAGFVRIASDPAQREILQTTVPDAPFTAYDDTEALAHAHAASRATVVGPGLGTDERAEAALVPLLTSPVPLVLDADALNLLAKGRPAAVEKLGATGPRVLTPHPGEMARLLKVEIDEVEADRPAAARRLAAASGAVVVLKGTPSLVATPDGALSVSALGSSDLAAAGMGDVLAGSLAALMAQGLRPADAAGAALLLGARAAARTAHGPGLTASDVVEALPGALVESELYGTDLPFGWVSLDLDAPR